MIPASAPSLSLSVRGGDAARALLAKLGVLQKRSDILSNAGFDDAARRLALLLLDEIEGPTHALADQLRDELSVNWATLTPARREAAISKAERLIGEMGRLVAPDLARALRGTGPTLIKATREAAIGRFKLPIAARLDASGVDSRAIEHLANAHELYVKDQYGRTSEIFGARARKIVANGLEQGYDYRAIGETMFDAIGAALGKGKPYCTMVASVFVARARSASVLSSFEDADIERYELSAVMDEATCFAGWTRVLLADGKTWAPIHKLRAGDAVMSCKGRPRRVIRRIESKARTWVSLVVRGARRPVQVTQTHGILTPSGWVRAQHLRAEGTPSKGGVRPITRIAVYDPENTRLNLARLWSDERAWGMRLGRIDPHTVDCHPWPAPDLAHLGSAGAFGEILDASQDTLGQTPTSCADAFDLEVDEDNGYIAEGMVVHNSNICRALDGKQFYTKEAIAKLEQVARSEKHDAIKELQPFVQDGKDEEGNPILYANQGGERVTVARVVESGVGAKDKAGEFEGMLSEAKLSSMGISMPPFHGRCRTLAIVAGIEHVGGGGGGASEARPPQVSVPVAVRPAKPKPAPVDEPPTPSPAPAPAKPSPAKPPADPAPLPVAPAAREAGPATVTAPPAPLAPSPPPPRFEDLPTVDWPVARPPAGGIADYRKAAADKINALSPAQTTAVQGFCKGYDWTIRQVEAGVKTDAEIAVAWKERLGDDYNPRVETAEKHVARARVFAREIEEAFATAKPTPLVVYRGLSDLTREQIDAFLASSTVEMKSTSSTSWNAGIGRDYVERGEVDSAHGVLLVLDQNSGLAVETVSAFDSEREVMLKKGSRFVITKLEKTGDGKVLVVHAREVMATKKAKWIAEQKVRNAAPETAIDPAQVVIMVDGQPARPARFVGGPDDVTVNVETGTVTI